MEDIKVFRVENMFIVTKKVSDKVLSGQGNTCDEAIEELKNRISRMGL